MFSPGFFGTYGISHEGWDFFSELKKLQNNPPKWCVCVRERNHKNKWHKKKKHNKNKPKNQAPQFSNTTELSQRPEARKCFHILNNGLYYSLWYRHNEHCYFSLGNCFDFKQLMPYLNDRIAHSKPHGKIVNNDVRLCFCIQLTFLLWLKLQ